MASGRRENRYCRCGTLLARDNTGRQCARCARDSRDRLIAPPEVPPGFWQTQQLREAFAAQHMGRIARAYRTHPCHYAVHGPHGISQTLLGQWIGISQPEISRFETGPPARYLDTLQRWARVLRIPTHLLWFQLPDKTQRRTLAAPARDASPASADGTERDPILHAPWNHRGTVEAVVVLSGGDQVKRRMFLSLTGPALTAPAHQWLVHEPEPLISGLNGRRISPRMVDRLSAVITELRTMDDVAGGGSVLDLGQQHFAWVAGLLDRASYDDTTARKLHTALAHLGQFCGWAAFDSGDLGLSQRYYIAGLRAAHTADDRLFGAHVLGSMAKQAAFHGSPAEALTMTDTALAGLKNERAPRLLAQLHIRRAYASAKLRDGAACGNAITKARTEIEKIDPEDGPAWLYWIVPAWITSEAGDCLLRSGQADKAAAMLREGVAMFDGSFDRDRQLYTIKLADALTRPGKNRDLDEAARLGNACIDAAESLDSTLSADLIRDLRFSMKPYTKMPAVRDFLERATSRVGA